MFSMSLSKCKNQEESSILNECMTKDWQLSSKEKKNLKQLIIQLRKNNNLSKQNRTNEKLYEIDIGLRLRSRNSSLFQNRIKNVP